MRILALGIGKIGAALLKDFGKCDDVSKVVAADIDINRVKQLVDQLHSTKIESLGVDVTDQDKLTQLIEGGFDVITSTLPLRFNINVIRAAIDAGVNYADVGSFPEQLHDTAKSRGITVVPCIGLEPGIDRVIEGYIARKLDCIEKIHMYVGGFPQKGTQGYNNPLKYKISWDFPLAIDMYLGFPGMRGGTPGKTKILKNGHKVEVDVLSGQGNPEIVRFPEPVGELEAFYSGAPFDTLDQLDLKGVNEAWDKTLRWPGHCEIIRKLIDLHLFSEDPIIVKGHEISPRDMFIEMGKKYLQYEKGEGDVVVERVEIIGEKNGAKIGYVYDIVDFYDPVTDITAMGRTTAFPLSIVSQMLGRGEIKEKGVLHASKIGWDTQLGDKFFNELARRDIHINRKMLHLN